ncbi:probable glucuronosyltransferase Os03g0287800 [Phragmites australis]|uniref:probable glucuronosyltransferase Os03g0287800 n=1 Tax=Phragmites australis TaxID=29695 RepID=UPI002D7A0491|nr:probable glucuronosyltransferase Os03g0287800 [Phragmites australis]
MGLSTDHGGAGGRAKKQGSQLWKKALLHSSLCFVMGFFTGFAPSSVSDWTPAAVSSGGFGSSHVVRALHAAAGGAVNRSLLAQDAVGGEGRGDAAASPRPLLVVVTTTESTPAAAGERAAVLTRMAHTLRLVTPPLLWVVVESAPDVPATARLLRATGLMYRHLTYKDNFTAADTAAGKERHHQRNVALGHIEHHRLDGFVLFAGLGDVFDLRFFDQLRQISAFGAWPVATMSRDERKVVVRGPACSSSAVAGWFSRDFSNGTSAAASTARPREVDVHGFAFNSSVLWDPERWGRYPASEPDKSQDSMKFVQQVVLEDYSKVKGIPSDCSEVMVWHVDTAASFSSSSQPSPGDKRR